MRHVIFTGLTHLYLHWNYYLLQISITVYAQNDNLKISKKKKLNYEPHLFGGGQKKKDEH